MTLRSHPRRTMSCSSTRGEGVGQGWAGDVSCKEGGAWRQWH